MNSPKEIDLKTIQEVSFSNKDFNIFDLQEFLGKRDFEKTASLYEDMSEV